jgi:hypothetical protein
MCFKRLKQSLAIMLFGVLAFPALFIVSMIPTVSGGAYWKYKTDGGVSSVGVSGDGEYVVAATWSDTVFLLNRNGSLLWTHHFAEDVECAAISEDGSRIAVGIHEYHSGKPDIYLFDNLGNIIWQKDLIVGWISTIRDVAISPDAGYIAAGDSLNSAYLYDIYGSTIWNYTVGNLVEVVSVSERGEHTAVGSWDKSLYLLNKTGNLLWSYEFDFFVNAASISPEGDYVAASCDDELLLFHKNGSLLLKTPFYISVKAVSLSDNADRIAVAAYQRVNIIDKTANAICELRTGTTIEDIAITANGKYVAFGSGNYVYFLEPLPPSEITCRVLPSDIFLGRSATITGSIQPQLGGEQVRLDYKLIVQDSTYNEDGFVNATTTVTTLANGSFTDVFTPIDTGQWKLTATWYGGTEYMASECTCFFNVNPAIETTLLSSTPITLYWHQEKWYCTEYFPSTPPVQNRHYFLNSQTPTSNDSKIVGFNPDSYYWIGHPEWGYYGAHTGLLSEDTLIEKGLWNLTIWASADEPNQHFTVHLCYWDASHDYNLISSWDSGHFNSTSPAIPIQLNHAFDLPQKIIPKESCIGFVIAVGPDSNINLFFDSTQHPTQLTVPPSTEVVSYTLTIMPATGGNTSPEPEIYTYVQGTEAAVTANPQAGYSFGHWELDGTSIGSTNPVDILMDKNHTLLAVFIDNIPPQISNPTQDPLTNIQPNQNVTVTVTITDEGSGIYSVTLAYTIDNGTTWIPLNMSKIGANAYQTKIPGHENCTWVRYKITAYDNATNSAVNDNAGHYYTYQVIPEFPTAVSVFLLLFFITTLILITKRSIDRPSPVEGVCE